MTVAELTIEARPRSDDVVAAPSAWYDPDSATFGETERHTAPEHRRDARIITVPASRTHDALDGEWA
jgi:hypothetical protein